MEMQMTDYVRCLVGLVETPMLSYTGLSPDYADIEWRDSRSQPSRAECDAAWPQFEYEDALASVQRQRRARYVAEADGLFYDAMRGDGDLTAWKALCAQIKADLPKPTPPA